VASTANGERRTRCARLAVAFVAVAAASAGGASAEAAERPSVSARTAIVVDARDGHVLYRRDTSEERPIASATKLMTALVAFQELPLGRELRAAPYHPAAAESRIDLRAGERMSVADLLRALLLESANDAAETLAVRSMGSVDRFVRRMNERAQELGLSHTRFANPVGLDSPGAHSTALDLSRLARRVLANDFLAATVDMPRARLLSGAHPRIVNNRNLLVREVGWVDGVKTGHTSGAGYVLVGSTSRKGARLVSVVLGAPSEAARDSDTLALLRYGLRQYRRTQPVRARATLATAGVKYFGDREVHLVPAHPVSVTVRRGQRLRTVVRTPGEVTGPLRPRSRVGSVTVYRDGRRIRTVAVVTASAVPEAGLLRKVWSDVWSPIVLLAALGVGTWLIVRRRRRATAAGPPATHAHERAG
jgi:D-alanyl-D-alanine carboxypeptidase (penicillin-binding protein 5/6)